TVNTPYATPLQVRLTGPGGRALAHVFPIIFIAPSAGPGGLFDSPGGPTPFFLTGTDANGVASAPFVANGVAGSFTVRGSADKIAGGANTLSHLTNTAPVVPAIHWVTPSFQLASQVGSFAISSTIPAGVAQPTYRIDWGDGTLANPDVQLIPVPT